MEDCDNGNKELWVFGYGSLCWNPGFLYKKSEIGYVKGYSRRFWQGNTTHRGTANKPGRVATLVEENEGTVYGRAFRVKDNSALPYLENRECALGGYIITTSTFYARRGNRSFSVIIYIATNENAHWLGVAPLHSIAEQIYDCSGPCGHNVEYLLRLAEFMHRYLPDARDDHLFTLELLVRARIKEENKCLKTLMGNRDFSTDLEELELEIKREQREAAESINAVNNFRENPLKFTSRIPGKCLRCMKM